MGKSSLLNLRLYSDELIDSIHYWVPPVPAFKPRKKKLNSSLRIAAIVDERLYRGLRYEGELFILTPSNWKQVLDAGGVDFLIVESGWQTITGHWYLGQYVHAEHKKELLEIVAAAKKKSIPTIYWNTQSHLYHSHYGEFAANFDFVFCSDPAEVKLLGGEGVEAEILPPAVQPAIHNAFTEFDPDTPEFSIDVLYDGFTDLYRLHDELTILKEIVPYGLKIVESQSEVMTSTAGDFPLLQDHFLGTVNYDDWLTLLKHTNVAITMDRTLRTETLQQWLTLETAACRVPVLHRGSFEEDDVRCGLISAFEDGDELLLMLECFYADDLYRKRIGHVAWRDIYKKHTFSHRVGKICNSINITHDYVEFPLVSVVTPTLRKEKVTQCLETFENQSYPHKELIVVMNRDTVDASSIEIAQSLENVHMLSVPQEKFAGAALNVGNLSAKGRYCFRMDDDDYYGEHYITDALLHLKSVDATVFGALFNYVYFEGEDKIFRTKNRQPSLVIAPQKFYGSKYFSITGNTLAAETDFFCRFPYQDKNFEAADTSFQRNIHYEVDYFVVLDEFNMVIHRAKDTSVYTWRVPATMIKKNTTLYDGVELSSLLF